MMYTGLFTYLTLLTNIFIKIGLPKNICRNRLLGVWEPKCGEPFTAFLKSGEWFTAFTDFCHSPMKAANHSPLLKAREREVGDGGDGGEREIRGDFTLRFRERERESKKRVR